MRIFFITKKLVGAMLMPLQFSLGLIVIVVVLLWLERWRQATKYLATAGALLLLVFSNKFVGYHLIHSLESRYPPLQLAQPGGDGDSAVQGAPAEGESGNPISKLGPDPLIVVLSGGASNNPTLPVAYRLYPDSTIRVDAAVEIYRGLKPSVQSASEDNRSSNKSNPSAPVVPRILMSGGPTLNSTAEAIPMREEARQMGVPAGAILMETRSVDTASEARAILPVVGRKPFILVTSAFHMPRAMGLFRHLGMEPIPAPCNYLGNWTTQPFVMEISPDTGALLQSEVALHERLGMIWERLRGQL